MCNFRINLQVGGGGFADVEVRRATETGGGDAGVKILVRKKFFDRSRERIFVSLREQQPRPADHFRQPGNSHAFRNSLIIALSNACTRELGIRANERLTLVASGKSFSEESSLTSLLEKPSNEFQSSQLQKLVMK